LWNTNYIRAALDPGRKEHFLYYTYSTACCRYECVFSSPPCIVRPILQHVYVINTSRQLRSGLVVQSSRLRKWCDETNLVTIQSFHETQIEIKTRHPQFLKHDAILCSHFTMSASCSQLPSAANCHLLLYVKLDVPKLRQGYVPEVGMF